MEPDETHEVDLVVIGTGPGGEALALECATAGLEVVAVERHLVGGECPYYGCIPSKIMVRAADALAEAGRAAELATDGHGPGLTPAWAPVAARVAEATSDWDDRAAVKRLEEAGARVVHGTGRLDGPHRVVVEPADGSAVQTYATRRGVVVDPGTRPASPPIEGLAGTPYWTNHDAVQVTELPGSLLVIGGGPIGAELVQVFARFGVAVTVVQHADRMLPRDEPEASQSLAEVLEREGVRLLTSVEVTRVSHAEDGFTVTLSTGETLTVDQLLVAAGRTPNLDGLGLESLELDPADLRVDQWMRAADGVWMLGDVVGRGAFTHVSMYQSNVAQRDILGEDGPPATYEAVPHVTFTDPEVAGVGLTEQQARDAGFAVRVGSSDLGSRGFTHGPGADGLIKVVADAERGVLLGATVVGPAAGEVLSMLTLAVHAQVPLSTLRSMIYAFPTFHRAVVTALADLEG